MDTTTTCWGFMTSSLAFGLSIYIIHVYQTSLLNICINSQHFLTLHQLHLVLALKSHLRRNTHHDTILMVHCSVLWQRIIYDLSSVLSKDNTLRCELSAYLLIPSLVFPEGYNEKMRFRHVFTFLIIASFAHNKDTRAYPVIFVYRFLWVELNLHGTYVYSPSETGWGAFICGQRWWQLMSVMWCVPALGLGGEVGGWVRGEYSPDL